MGERKKKGWGVKSAKGIGVERGNSQDPRKFEGRRENCGEEEEKDRVGWMEEEGGKNRHGSYPIE